MASKYHKLFWGSSYDRGLDILLFFWGDIKKEYPDAELHVCYGWDLFDKIAGNNQERMKWKEGVVKLMQQDGVIHHGRLGKKELGKIRQSCGIWAYPTYFPEINCITALDCQRDGLVPAVMNYAALKETVGVGIKVDGDIKDKKVMEKFRDELIELMGDGARCKLLSKQAKKFAKDYSWDKTANKWIDVLREPISTPRVNVITVTIRTGFWNIMARNLSRQTYKNFNWIIVDDYEEDRSEIAEKYAKKYNLEVKYVRGKREVKRKYGLVSSNNTAIENCDGELSVWLQDFILIKENAIERLVDVYRHHEDALIAPTDLYYDIAGEVDRKNKEDWFNGRTDVVGEFNWANVRNKNIGIRYSQNPADFEMNWGAIPVKILKELNGWWEFFDDGMGYDNTEIAYRAMRLGYKVLVDDVNVAICLNLWPIIKGEKENIEDREFNLNTPRYWWFMRMMDGGGLPVIRNVELDNKIKLPFKVDKDIKESEASDWINKNAKKIVSVWEKEINIQSLK